MKERIIKVAGLLMAGALVFTAAYQTQGRHRTAEAVGTQIDMTEIGRASCRERVCQYV